MKTLIKPTLLIFALLLQVNLFSQGMCDPNCQADTVLNFSTGWDPATNALSNGGPGTIDPSWELINLAPLQNGVVSAANIPDAHFIATNGGNWNIIPGSKILSFVPNTSFTTNNFNGGQPWRFRKNFCVCDTTIVNLTGRIKGDDTGSLNLYDGNGVPMPFVVSLLPAPNSNNFHPGVAFNQTLTLAPGKYFFEFELRNTNNVATGFAVQGIMTSQNINGLPTLSHQDPACCATSLISGQKILDANCDGVFNGNDQLGRLWDFDLIDPVTGWIIQSTIANQFGEFFFNNLSPGNYIVRERPQWGWDPSSPVTGSMNVTVGINDVQYIRFFNCEYEPFVFAGCAYGDVVNPVLNVHNEYGLNILQGTEDSIRTLMRSTMTDNVTNNNRIVRTTWDNTPLLTGAQRSNRFDDVGTHTILNLHSVATTSFPSCNNGDYVVMGTTNDAGNSDVFYSEFNESGEMLFYVDATNSLDEDEVVNDLIQDSNGDLLWTGTKTNAAGSKMVVYRYSGCNVDVQREYEFAFTAPLEGTGHSIIELNQLQSWPAAKYAVTGSVGNENYLVFLTANLNLNATFKFDIDSDVNTAETGIRLRQLGDAIIIVGNSKKINLNLGQNGSNRLFMQRFDFTPGTPSTSFIQENHIYDIAGGGETVIDMEMNSRDELILTGVSNINQDAIMVSFGPKTQMAYTMSIDPSGNLLWQNQIQLQDGSEPRDIWIHSNDEFALTGFCWKNELINSGGIQQWIQKYDQLTIKADKYGELAYEGPCQEPLTATRLSPTETWTDLGVNFMDIPENTLDYPFQVLPFFPNGEFCNDGSGGGIDCDSVNIVSSIWNNPDHSCCYELEYKNNSPLPLYELCFDLLPATCIFDIVNIDPAFSFASTPGSNQFCVVNALGTALPTGMIPNSFRFCFANAGGPNPIVNYSWNDAFGNRECGDSEEFECAAGDDDPCIILIDTVYCDTLNPNFYVYEFDVENLSNGPVSKVNFYGMTPGFVIGGFVNPLVLTPPLNNFGDISGTYSAYIFNNTGSPITQPTNVYFYASGIDSLGCCHDLDPICVTLMPCCDPCDNVGVIENTSVTFPEECCYSLDVFNNCPDAQMSYIETNVITPGVVFGSHNLGVGYGYPTNWTNTFVNNRSLTWQPITGNPFPMGSFPELINFCLDSVGQTTPVQEIEVNYYVIGSTGMDSLACTDTLQFECDPVDLPCVALVEDSIYCDSLGNYFYDWEFMNISSPPFNADKIQLNIISPISLIMAPNCVTGSIPSGGTISGTSLITPFPSPAPAAGDIIKYTVTLLNTNVSPNDTSWCCHESDTICIVLPPCDPPSCCGDPNFPIIVDNTQFIYDNPTKTLVVDNDPALFCSNPLVSVYVDWGDGNFVSGSTNDFDFTHTYSTDGTYQVCLLFTLNDPTGQICEEREVCSTIEVETTMGFTCVECPDTLQWDVIDDNIPGIIYDFQEHNGFLWIAGQYPDINGQILEGITTWDGTTFTDRRATSFAATYRDLQVLNGELFAAVEIYNATGPSNFDVAKWNSITLDWDLLNLTVNLSIGASNLGFIIALESFHNQLAIGGQFDAVNGIPVNSVCLFNPVTNSVTSMNSTIIGQVYEFENYNGDLLVGGNFSGPGDHVARVSPSFTWSTLSVGFTIGTPVQLNGVQAFQELPSGELLIGGRFDNANNTTGVVAATSGLALYDPISNIYTDYGGGITGTPSQLNTVNDIKLINNKIFISGYFGSIGGQTINGLTYYDGTSFFDYGVVSLGVEAIGCYKNSDDFCEIWAGGENILGTFRCTPEPEDCCMEQMDFIDMADATVYTESSHDLTLTNPLFVFCDPVYLPEAQIDWGDGTTSTVNTAPMNVTHTYTATGTYFITVLYTYTGPDGVLCMEAVDNYTMVITNINELPAGSVELFPNPTNSTVYLKTTGIEIDQIESYNLMGQRISIQWNGTDQSIIVSHLAAGTYYIRVTDIEKRTSTLRLAKM